MNQLSRICTEEDIARVGLEELFGSSSDDEAVDLASILTAYGDEHVVEEVVRAFLENGHQSLQLIANAIEPESPEEMAFYTHVLEGSARYVAAEQLAERAPLLEVTGRKKEMAKAPPLFEQMEVEFEKVLSYLSEVDWIKAANQQPDHMI